MGGGVKYKEILNAVKKIFDWIKSKKLKFSQDTFFFWH